MDLTIEQEIKVLERECLTQKGKPRANCDLEKLRRLIELKAEGPELPEIEECPDDEKKLRSEYGRLVKILFDHDGEKYALKPKSKAKDLARWNELRDMLRQPEPKKDRISMKAVGDENIIVKVSAGAPVNLEGRQNGLWKSVARIMPLGGQVTVPVDKYQAFRISRGTDKPEFHEIIPKSANPNKKKDEKKEKGFDVTI